MNRLEAKLKSLKSSGQKAFVPFITAGFPSLAHTKKLVLCLEKAGADAIELGLPFSDPMADGPVIQQASEKALAKQTTLPKVLRLVREIRSVSQIPLVLMGYYNPIFSYGLSRYAHDAARAGLDATLVVDLPPEESAELDRELKKKRMNLIYLLAPTSNAKRIQRVIRAANGFIYFVSMTGVTGAALQSFADVRQQVSKIRRKTHLPVLVGFGISNAAQAKKMATLADGVVVGSALVSLISKCSPKNIFTRTENFTRQLVRGTRS